jgi:hypothetical protein
MIKTPITNEWLLKHCDTLDTKHYKRFFYRGVNSDSILHCLDITESYGSNHEQSHTVWASEYNPKTEEEHDTVLLNYFKYREDLITLWCILGGDPNKFKDAKGDNY